MPPDLALIVFVGLPGTGKSSLARQLARELRAVYLSLDTLQGCLAAMVDVRGSDEGRSAVVQQGYALLLDLARDNLSVELSVILDSPAGDPAFRDRAKQLARSLKANMSLIECICTDERLLRQRIEGSSQDWAAYQLERAHFVRPNDRRLVVDTAESVYVNMRKLLAYLNQSEPGSTSQ